MKDEERDFSVFQGEVGGKRVREMELERGSLGEVVQGRWGRDRRGRLGREGREGRDVMKCERGVCEVRRERRIRPKSDSREWVRIRLFEISGGVCEMGMRNERLRILVVRTLCHRSDKRSLRLDILVIELGQKMNLHGSEKISAY